MKTPWQKGQGRKEADQMEVIIKGEAQEIAALVLAVQGRQEQVFIPCDAETEQKELKQKCIC